MAVFSCQVEPISLAHAGDEGQCIRAKRCLAFKAVQHDALKQVPQTHLMMSSHGFQHLQHPFFQPHAGLHQPARQKIFFPMKNIFRAAMSAGALGVFLSGAGSSVLALTRDREYTIGYEMADAAMKSGVEGAIKVTQPTALGAQVVEG